MNNVDPTKNRGELSWSEKVSSSFFLKIPTALSIFQSGISHFRVKKVSLDNNVPAEKLSEQPVFGLLLNVAGNNSCFRLNG